MIVVDTSELRRPVQRKLHAAWWELSRQQVLSTPTVATELAPLGADPTGVNGRSAADVVLETAGPETGERRRTEVAQQAWWATMWRSPESPYRIVPLTRKQEELTERLLEKIDRRCFPTTDPVDIDRSNDARIVCEAVATGAKMLLTSNMRTIDRSEVNRWAIENGGTLGFKPEAVLFQADATFVEWTSQPAELERWIQAGLIACWPADDDTPAMTIIDRTREGIGAMSRGSGGKLQEAGRAAAQRLGAARRPGEVRRTDTSEVSERDNRNRPLPPHLPKRERNHGASPSLTGTRIPEIATRADRPRPARGSESADRNRNSPRWRERETTAPRTERGGGS